MHNFCIVKMSYILQADIIRITDIFGLFSFTIVVLIMRNNDHEKIFRNTFFKGIITST